MESSRSTESDLQEIDALQAGYSTDELDCGSSDKPSMTAAFHAKASPAKPKKSCAYCKDSHFPNDCIVVSDRAKRLDIVKRDKLCFNCLGKHRVSECKSRFSCRVCRRKHHRSLHQDRMDNNTDKTAMATVNTPATETHVQFAKTEESYNASNSRNGPILLKTAVVPVSTKRQTVDATVLFDEGATRSFVTRTFATKLGLKIKGTEVIRLTSFGDNQPRERSIDVTTLTLNTLSGQKIDISVLIVPQITTRMTNFVTRSLINVPYLRELTLAHPVSDATSFEISVLIGADYYWDFVEDRVIRGSGPTAVSSKFGYLLSGPIHSGKATKSRATILHILTDTCEEESQLKVYWDLETIGIKDELLANNKTKDDFELYRDTHLRIENGKYVARLPWKPDHPALPTNYNIAEMRTRSMARRLTPDILEAYDKSFPTKRRGISSKKRQIMKASVAVATICHITQSRKIQPRRQYGLFMTVVASSRPILQV
ncbi:uncharacterized protein [Ptychodera flava]|uniref:uncharacterized protein n=1 Tax=Ptychodera flava TaxID=63121 RepID=UPI00396A4945